MASDINALSPAFALFCGDLIAGTGTIFGNSAEWKAWGAPTYSLQRPRFMVPGENDPTGPTPRLNSVACMATIVQQNLTFALIVG